MCHRSAKRILSFPILTFFRQSLLIVHGCPYDHDVIFVACLRICTNQLGSPKSARCPLKLLSWKRSADCHFISKFQRRIEHMQRFVLQKETTRQSIWRFAHGNIYLIWKPPTEQMQILVDIILNISYVMIPPEKRLVLSPNKHGVLHFSRESRTHLRILSDLKP